MAVFSLTPLYSVPSPSPVPLSEFSEETRLRTASRALRTGRVTGRFSHGWLDLHTLLWYILGSALSQRSRDESPCPASIPSKYRTVFYQLTENKGFQMQSPRFEANRYSVSCNRNRLYFPNITSWLCVDWGSLSWSIWRNSWHTRQERHLSLYERNL